MPRGWHPERKTEPGGTHRKALATNCDTWALGGAVGAGHGSGPGARGLTLLGHHATCVCPRLRHLPGRRCPGEEEQSWGKTCWFFSVKNHLLFVLGIIYHTVIPVCCSSCDKAALLLSWKNKWHQKSPSCSFSSL